MKATPLRAFVGKVTEANRLSFGDLRRLQRDILPNGPQSRHDVVLLLGVDVALERADSGWRPYLVAAVKDFALAACGSPGVVGPELGHWLASALANAKPKTALDIARAVIAEATEVDDELRAVAKISPKRQPKSLACSTGLSAEKVAGPVPLSSGYVGSCSFAWRGIGVCDALEVRVKRRS